MQTATQTTQNAPLVPRLAEQGHLVTRERSRCLFWAGDLFTPTQKASVERFKAGGEELPPLLAPTLWFTGFILKTCAFTPLYKKLVKAHADVRKGEGGISLHQVEVPRGDGTFENASNYYEAYPGQDMQMFVDDYYSALGVVEITALQGEEEASGKRASLQRHFFPDWDGYERGEIPYPATLRERVALIEDGIARANSEAGRETGAQMLESARRFRVWAEKQININRNLVNAGVNEKGYSVGWSPLVRHLAAQLEIELTPENQARNSVQAQLEAAKAQADTNALLAEQFRTQNEAMQRILERLVPQEEQSTVSSQQSTVKKNTK